MWHIALHLGFSILKACPIEAVLATIICIIAACFLLPVLKILFKPIIWLLNIQLEDLNSTELEDSEDSQKHFSPLVKFIALFVYGYLWVKQLIQRYTASPNIKKEKSSNYDKTYRY